MITCHAEPETHIGIFPLPNNRLTLLGAEYHQAEYHWPDGFGGEQL